MTHVNLYDDTVEGVAHRTRPVFSVQYHPEAAPGPHDSRYLFQQFVQLMENGSRSAIVRGSERLDGLGRRALPCSPSCGPVEPYLIRATHLEGSDGPFRAGFSPLFQVGLWRGGSLRRNG